MDLDVEALEELMQVSSHLLNLILVLERERRITGKGF
jgi:hypothetical protein